MSRRSYQNYNDQSIQKVSAGSIKAGGKVEFEKIQHISGSAAGASSSAFDVYRGARKRERDRMESLEESDKLEEESRTLAAKVEQNRLEAEQRLSKNSDKRNKKKLRKMLNAKLGKNIAKDGGKNQDGGSGDDDDDDDEADGRANGDNGKSDENSEITSEQKPFDNSNSNSNSDTTGNT